MHDKTNIADLTREQAFLIHGHIEVNSKMT